MTETTTDRARPISLVADSHKAEPAPGSSSIARFRAPTSTTSARF